MFDYEIATEAFEVCEKLEKLYNKGVSMDIVKVVFRDGGLFYIFYPKS